MQTLVVSWRERAAELEADEAAAAAQSEIMAGYIAGLREAADVAQVVARADVASLRAAATRLLERAKKLEAAADTPRDSGSWRALHARGEALRCCAGEIRQHWRLQTTHLH